MKERSFSGTLFVYHNFELFKLNENNACVLVVFRKYLLVVGLAKLVKILDS